MYIPAGDLSFESLVLSRRTFLKSCSILGLCLAGCESFTTKTRFVSAMINDPHPDEYRPVLHHLITTILPFEDQRFPKIVPSTIESSLYSLFPIDEEERFVILQKTLVFFNEISLFPHLFSPIADEEKNSLDVTLAVSVEEIINEKQKQDKLQYSNFFSTINPSADRFTMLTLEQQRDYLQLWSQSGFLIKRQFYRSLKSLVMITAYSSEELWKAIGYEGPLLSKR